MNALISENYWEGGTGISTKAACHLSYQEVSIVRIMDVHSNVYVRNDGASFNIHKVSH